jgi:hypothetical protein
MPLLYPERVEVDPTAQDEEIASRLQRILESTHWFHDPTVRVDNGVVYLGLVSRLGGTAQFVCISSCVCQA